MARIIALLVLAVAVTGCSSWNLSTAITGIRLAPLELDPAGLEFFFAVPDNVDLSSGDAKILLAYAPLKGEEADVVKSEIGLAVHRFEPSGEFNTDFSSNLYRARIPESQLSDFRNTQAEISNMKSNEINGVGTFAVRIHSACYYGQSPEPFFMTAWIRTEPGGAIMPLARKVDLWTVLSAWAATDLRERVRECT
ncbi:hypothetical protein [Marinobacter algicola]|uniref:Lipoprotein n=1 Tax=Marinobacter algicola DG893 TaxID=443152 RepID=A6F4A7_9GAMM|nr:hypothetical protein [Marinobacter algicola]EDM46400.1 hypothetical protein MDG893_13094 [Marinobacter algicola DG893]